MYTPNHKVYPFYVNTFHKVLNYIFPITLLVFLQNINVHRVILELKHIKTLKCQTLNYLLLFKTWVLSGLKQYNG